MTTGVPDGSAFEPRLKPFPRITDVQSLFRLTPVVQDIGDPGVDDGLTQDGERIVCRYRFFRDCDRAPFVASSDRFQALNAWYLADASLLAYATTPLTSTEDAALAGAEETIRAQISPALRRLFAAVARRDRTQGEVAVKVFVRSSPLVVGPLVDPVQCFVADNGAIGIVAFRGTLPASLPNWLTDFEPALVPLTRGDATSVAAVHCGFRQAALALLDDRPQREGSGLKRDDPLGGAGIGLRAYLASRLKENPGLLLWFTGHSLGAALATLAAYAVGNVQALYTFGSPRVGDVRFAELFAEADIPHYRFVHHDDVVPHVPIPLPPLFGYEHVGDLKYIAYADEDAVRSDAPEPVAAKVSDSPALESQLGGTFAGGARWLFDEVGRLKIGFLARSIDRLTDHAPLYYSNLLWNSFVKERARLLGLPDP